MLEGCGYEDFPDHGYHHGYSEFVICGFHEPLPDSNHRIRIPIPERCEHIKCIFIPVIWEYILEFLVCPSRLEGEGEFLDLLSDKIGVIIESIAHFLGLVVGEPQFGDYMSYCFFGCLSWKFVNCSVFIEPFFEICYRFLVSDKEDKI